jgi:uncharacterized membrane protein
MTTSSLPLPRISRARGKYAVFALIAMMLAYVGVHNESYLIHRQDPFWEHIQPFKWYLFAHGVAGACALLLAPLQFSDRLRRKYVQLHHRVGYIYVLGTAIAAPFGFYIQYFHERMGSPRSFSFAAATQATSWILTTSIAMIMILQGKTEAHRRWMTRSFAVCLVFLEVRAVEGITGWDTLSVSVDETVVWACNVFTLLAADMVLQVQELVRSGPLRKAARSMGSSAGAIRPAIHESGTSATSLQP